MNKLQNWLSGTAVALMMISAPALADDIRIGLSSEPSAIDPHYHNLGPNNMIARHLFDRLILQNEKQQLQPGLALSWKPIDDTTWEFKLREGDQTQLLLQPTLLNLLPCNILLLMLVVRWVS
ncbi:MAG: hypothetical protein JKY10_03770, partial [Cohaesibacteraceae bacterium]|nr:hypothetical protein [Cohaesibacteraceae bacterium]